MKIVVTWHRLAVKLNYANGFFEYLDYADLLRRSRDVCQLKATYAVAQTNWKRKSSLVDADWLGRPIE